MLVCRLVVAISLSLGAVTSMQPVLDGSGLPIPLDECEDDDDDVDGYPCSPFTITPFQDVFTTTDAFNPEFQPPASEPVCRDDGHCADIYEFDVIGIQVELFNNILDNCQGNPTKLLSYGGTVPARTIRAVNGRELFVRFNNEITEADTPRPEMYDFEGCNPEEDGKEGVPIAIHNHGQASIAPFDGFAIDRICLGETKDYMYPNNRPTTGYDQCASVILG